MRQRRIQRRSTVRTKFWQPLSRSIFWLPRLWPSTDQIVDNWYDIAMCAIPRHCETCLNCPPWDLNPIARSRYTHTSAVLSRYFNHILYLRDITFDVLSRIKKKKMPPFREQTKTISPRGIIRIRWTFPPLLMVCFLFFISFSLYLFVFIFSLWRPFLFFMQSDYIFSRRIRCKKKKKKINKTTLPRYS